MRDYIEIHASDHLHRLTVPAGCAGLRLDQALARLLPEYSRNRLQDWMRSGRITLDAAAASAKTRVWGGETVVVAPQPVPSDSAPAAEDIALDVVFEDDVLLVLDKPAGLVVHPGSGNWSGTLLNALLRHAPALAGIPRAGIVHRLDKQTSGLLVVAKTIAAQVDLVRQLQARSVTREYAAIVFGNIAREGVVDAPIGRHPVQRTRMAVVAGGKSARTHFSPLESARHWSRLRCRLETGRTHQIRVHLHSLGHPLIGDPVYRSGRQVQALPAQALDFRRQALHAERLRLLHPASRESLEFDSPLPGDMQQLLAALRHADPA